MSAKLVGLLLEFTTSAGIRPKNGQQTGAKRNSMLTVDPQVNQIG